MRATPDIYEEAESGKKGDCIGSLRAFKRVCIGFGGWRNEEGGGGGGGFWLKKMMGAQPTKHKKILFN